MAIILTLDQTRRRSAPSTAGTNGPAEVLMFTGVRREPLLKKQAPHMPRHHAPMFEDPAPDRPTGRKRRRGKTG